MLLMDSDLQTNLSLFFLASSVDRIVCKYYDYIALQINTKLIQLDTNAYLCGTDKAKKKTKQKLIHGNVMQSPSVDSFLFE